MSNQSSKKADEFGFREGIGLVRDGYIHVMPSVLLHLAHQMRERTLTDEEIGFLAGALEQIARSADPVKTAPRELLLVRSKGGKKTKFDGARQTVRRVLTMERMLTKGFTSDDSVTAEGMPIILMGDPPPGHRRPNLDEVAIVVANEERLNPKSGPKDLRSDYSRHKGRVANLDNHLSKVHEVVRSKRRG